MPHQNYWQLEAEILLVIKQQQTNRIYTGPEEVTLLLLIAHKPQWHFPDQITTLHVPVTESHTHTESKHFVTVVSVHIQYWDLHSITKARATYCIKWNPFKFLMQYFQRKNNFLNLFLAYLVHKHYIAMYWAHHNYLWPH